MNMNTMWQKIYCLHTCFGLTLALIGMDIFHFDEHPNYTDISCMVGNSMTHPRDSLISCATLCVFTNNCKGVFYISMTTECRLQLAISIPGHACKQDKQDNGSHYYYITKMIPILPYSLTTSDVARLEHNETVDDICRSYPYQSLNDGVKDGHINCSYMPCCLSQGCFNGHVTNYTGTWSITRGGILCQMWLDQLPQRHTWHEDEDFPDETMAAAQNYCRDPDDEGGLWCYTMDPDERWDWCDVLEC